MTDGMVLMIHQRRRPISVGSAARLSVLSVRTVVSTQGTSNNPYFLLMNFVFPYILIVVMCAVPSAMWAVKL
jgi:hypothetical protein